VLVGLAWLLLLPLNEYSRQTYVSENALLPGQVHTYFGGSEQNVFRAYKKEIEAGVEYETARRRGCVDDGADKLEGGCQELEIRAWRNDRLKTILQEIGLKVGVQRYEYTSSGKLYEGENIYAILHAPRGDATEAIVLVAAWENMEGELNKSGIPLLLTLARYFKRE
jgi:glycosylphosphatidylinositol transamidase